MAVDKSRRPYFDDYNEEKGFHEVLFRPSRPVQTRELNQIQSMFYEQVSRFGDHVFEDGSMVIPGESNYDLDLDYVTVTISNYDNVASQLIAGNITLSGSNGITANVKLVEHPEDGDPLTFYIEYLDASDSGDTAKFVTSDVVDVINTNGNTIAQATIDSNGIGSKFTVNSGVFYMSGRFVLVPQQTAILDKYSNTPSKVVGLQYVESIVTENDDPSLFDNAQGSPNFSAPGAHRLTVDVDLVVYDLADIDTIPDNVVEIFRIENGNVQKKTDAPDYAVLNDVMAQRTYEESGNYTVTPFRIGFASHEDTFGTVDEDRFGIRLDAGLAYVKGYRIQTLDTTDILGEKARSTAVLNNSSLSAALGYYILTTGLNIIPNVADLQQVTFYDSAVVTPGVQPSGTALGTARVRFVRREGSDYRLYLFDVRNASGARTTGFIANALSVHSSDGNAFTADLVDSELKDPSNNSLLFPTNVEFVKSLKDSNGDTDTSFSSVKQLSAVLDSNGRATFTAASNEVFVAQESSLAFGSYTDTDTLVDVHDVYSLGGSPTGSIITLDYGVGEAGRPIRVNLQVAKQAVSQKTKTTTTGTTSGTVSGGQLSLEKADAIEITSVIDNNGDDITSSFTLVKNTTQSYYGVSYVTTSASVANPVTVNFKYFAHSSGDYFGPDSYVDVAYEDIPTEGDIRLSDVLDFRPRMADDGTGFSGAGSVVGNIPSPFTIVRADVEHYLPRIDKVYVNVEGKFGVRQGVPALNPKEPEDPTDVMVLYRMSVPAYTFNLSDVKAEKVSNRRYTMKDIGRLEQRLANVEYYVTLNFLEQETDAKQIIDPNTGLNRFKNGFLVDAFVDHSVGDFGWPLYHVSMSDEGEMRPEFSLNAADLEVDANASTNVSINNGIATLPFTEKTFLRQNLRSTTVNVNPYAVYRWAGDITLSPSVDSWIDTVYTNPEVTYEVFNNGRLTQTWNSWQLNWSGGSNTRRNTTTDQGAFTRTTTTTTTTTRTNVDVVGNRVVDTSVIPFMRSINVEVTGIGHRPKTRLHFFFDGKKVNQYVRPAGGNFGDAVKADADGKFFAVYRIPNNSAQRFRTGEKQLIVTDEPDNKRELSTSYGETTFVSSGTRNTRQRRIIATRNVNTSTRTRTTVTRTPEPTRTTFGRTIGGRFGGDSDGGGGGGGADPLAQSFLVEREGGVFLTKVRVFFSTKDDRVPIKVEMREMENGVPTLRVVPGGIKTLNPADVSTSSDGSVPTDFEFDYPVYLMNGMEYCFVLMSNSNQYNAHVATLGEQDRGTGRYITRQPYTGVMFKSQNNTTWTEDQNSDVQFEIFCAEFDTNVTGQLVFNNTDLDTIRLGVNPVDTTNGNTDVVINREQHNYVVGTQVTITGAVAGNGIADADLNGTHTVTEIVSPNQFKIDVGTAATATGEIGGADLEISNTIQATLINPNIADIELTDTSISYEAKGTVGQSIDGTESAYQAVSDYQSVTNKEINALNVPWIITNRDDETANMAGSRSLFVRANMASNNPNVSPVIDLQGANVITPFCLITSPDTVEVDGSNNWANYRSKVTGIKQPANALRVYMDAQKPQGSEIILSARTGNSDEELEEASWVQMTTVVAQTTGDGEDFLENEFELEGLDDFTKYQVMIQLKSVSSTNFPVCKRLRVLALGT